MLEGTNQSSTYTTFSLSGQPQCIKPTVTCNHLLPTTLTACISFCRSALPRLAYYRLHTILKTPAGLAFCSFNTFKIQHQHVTILNLTSAEVKSICNISLAQVILPPQYLDLPCVQKQHFPSALFRN